MNDIISEKKIRVNNRELNIIKVKKAIDNSNFQILMEKLKSEILRGKKIIALELSGCDDFLIDAISAMKIINIKLRERNGFLYLLNPNEKVKNNFSILKKKYNNLYFCTLTEFVKIMSSKDEDIEIIFRVLYKKVILKNQKIRKKTIIIGRDEKCDIILPDKNRIISRKHAKIEVSKKYIIIINTSKNGTFINEVPIKRIPIKNGTLVRIGDYLIQINYKE